MHGGGDEGRHVDENGAGSCCCDDCNDDSHAAGASIDDCADDANDADAPGAASGADGANERYGTAPQPPDANVCIHAFAKRSPQN